MKAAENGLDRQRPISEKVGTHSQCSRRVGISASAKERLRGIRPGVTGAVFGFLWVIVLAAPSPAAAVDLDCSDFGTREAANKELNRTLEETGRDANRLDADRDGQACERNGSAMVWAGIGAAGGVLAAIAVKHEKRSDSWVNGIGHAVLAAFVGAFLGWLLPGILPRTISTSIYAITVGIVAAVSELTINYPSSTRPTERYE
jgi:hypothetical protein